MLSLNWKFYIETCSPEILRTPTSKRRVSGNRRCEEQSYLRAMSLIVRNKDTGCYLQAHDLWTRELNAAMRFNSGLRLVDYVEHGGVKEKNRAHRSGGDPCAHARSFPAFQRDPARVNTALRVVRYRWRSC